MSKSILVTGSRGFIGAELTKYLRMKNYRVLGTCRKEQESADEITLQPFESLEIPNQKVDAIVHLAGEYIRSNDLISQKAMSDGIIGTASTVADYLRRNPIPVISVGSYFEKSPFGETGNPFYTEAKRFGQKIIKKASLDVGSSFNIIYLYDTYGNDLRRRKFLDQLLTSAINSEWLDAKNPNQVIDLTSVSDVARGITLILERSISSEVGFNEWQIRSHKERTLGEIAGIAEKIFGKRLVKWNPDSQSAISELWESANDVPGLNMLDDLEDFIKKQHESRTGS